MKVLGFLRQEKKEMDAVNFYRTYLPLREVNKHDNGIEAQCVTPADLQDVDDADLAGRDIYTMCRMYNQELLGLFIDKIHSAGGLFVFDSDDDLTEEYKMVSGRGDEFRQTLAAADYVTCSTHDVAKVFAKYTQHAPVVVENRVDVSWMQATAQKGKRLIETLTLGFTGSPTHWGDWYLPAVPFARIGKDYPGVTLVLHGETPRYLKYADAKATVLKLGGVPFSTYPVLLRQFDIVLCAVNAQDKFNSGKSAVKALECMALGVIPICSNFRPYLDLCAAGAPVVMVPEDTRDAWYETIRTLVEDEDLRRDLSSRGPDWVHENRDMGNGGYKQWEHAYKGMTG